MRTAPALASLFGACALHAAAAQPGAVDGIADLHSFANVDQFATKHIELILQVDLQAHDVIGSAVLELQRLDPGATQLILDTRGLTVLGVSTLTSDIVGATEQPKAFWVSRPYHFGKADRVLGRALIIDMPQQHQAKEVVKIEYETTADAPGLVWAGPTPGEPKAPLLLYTESEPVNARSWIPLQDTPRARFTYRAHIQALGNALALMGGVIDPKVKRSGDYWFVMADAVAPQFMALGVGDFAFKASGPRTGVYLPPRAPSGALAEFSDVPALLEAGEQLLGRVHSGRFDVVLMPDAFPGGAWSNPHLAFVSPSLVATDRGTEHAAAAAVADAIAANWTREGVTGAEWRDRWIGVSLAAYLADRMLGAVYGEQRAAEHALEQWEALRELAADEQILSRDLADPATLDLFDPVPAWKGRLWFATLERQFGRETLDGFIRAFFARYAGRTVTTADFVDLLTEQVFDARPGVASRADALAWIYDPGIPRNAALPDPAVWAEVERARSQFIEGGVPAAKLDAKRWTPEQWRHFLRGMPTPLGLARMTELDKAFDLTAAPRGEVLTDWLLLAIRENYRPAYRRLEETLAIGGRPELLAPLYRLLVGTPDGALLARRVYSKARPGYHRAATAVIDPIVNIEAETEVQ